MAALRDSKGRFISRAAQATMSFTVTMPVPRFDNRQKLQTQEYVSPRKRRSMNRKPAPVALSMFA